MTIKFNQGETLKDLVQKIREEHDRGGSRAISVACEDPNFATAVVLGVPAGAYFNFEEDTELSRARLSNVLPAVLSYVGLELKGATTEGYNAQAKPYTTSLELAF